MKKTILTLFLVILLTLSLLLQSCVGVNNPQDSSDNTSSGEGTPEPTPIESPESSPIESPESSPVESPEATSTEPVETPPETPPESTKEEISAERFEELQSLAKQTFGDDVTLNEIIGVYGDVIALSLTDPAKIQWREDYVYYGCYFIKVLPDGTRIYAYVDGEILPLERAAEEEKISSEVCRQAAMIWYEKYKPYWPPAYFPEDPFAYTDEELGRQQIMDVMGKVCVAENIEEVINVLGYIYYEDEKYLNDSSLTEGYYWQMCVGTIYVAYNKRSGKILSVTYDP